MTKYSIGIVGATGYTGTELIRILGNHPNVTLKIITSESHFGKKISDIYPYLKGICDKKLMKKEDIKDHDLDLVFLGLPHSVSMEFVNDYWNGDYKIVDLSGDFRLSSAEKYEKWYNVEHKCPELLKDAVYGLPEIYRDQIKVAKFVSNPGCYPTSAILALSPLIKNGMIQQNEIIIDSKSGVSGAGAKPNDITHFPNVNEDLKAYAIAEHRHTPEIEEVLSNIGNGNDITLLFTPHLIPLNRGILTTIYCNLNKGYTENDIYGIFDKCYSKEPFVRVIRSPVSVQNVRGSNICDINSKVDDRTKKVIITSAIDNLIKGASGQAIQNMNLMLGFKETIGLNFPPITP